MKKSTLITTIAMIVVVVVALSTATYAWFTTSTKSQASDTLTTTAQSGWYLYGGAVSDILNETVSGYQMSRNVVYSRTDPISLHLMNSGLFSPAAALGTDLTNAQGNDLAATFTDTQFFSAKQNGFGVQDTAEVETAVAFTHTVSEQNVENLNCIRVVNGTGGTADLHLTILVYIESPTTTAEVAGMGFATYINTSAASGNVFTTGYYYGDGFTLNSSTGTGAVGDTAARNTTKATGAITIPESYTTNTETVKYFGTGDRKTTIAVGGKYYTVDVTLKSGMTAGEALNLVFYAWFDGWALDSTAQGGTIAINYAFGSAATTVTTTA